MIAVLDELANDVETNANGHYPGTDNGDVADAVALAGRRAFHAAGISTLPGARRTGVG